MVHRMRLNRASAPFKVRLNQSLVPARLLSFCTKRQFVVNDFEVNYSILHADGVASYGDPMFRKAPLGPSTFLDLFVFDPTQEQYQFDGPGHFHVQPIPPGQVLSLSVSWSGINGERLGGEARLLWSFDELRSGQAPRLAFGAEVEAVDQFTTYGGRHVTSEILGLRRRVKEMSRADIRERRRREVLRNSMEQTSTPSPLVSGLSVSGFRGFRETSSLKLSIPNGVAGSGLTVVVGANNAGKSSLWECFDAVARKLSGMGEVSFTDGQRNHASPNGVQIALDREDGATYNLQTLDQDTSETTAGWHPLDPNVQSDLKIVVLPSRRYFRALFGKGGDSRADWMNTGMGFNRNQERDPFTARLFALHADKEKKAKFDDLLEKVVGTRLEWKIALADGQDGMSSYYLRVRPAEGVSHNSDGLGDGIISLLFILDAIYDLEPDTLLVIDEPELSLHPQLIRRLGREIARVAAERQIVIFTHSPLLISWDDIKAGAEIARIYKTGADSFVAQPSRTVIDDVSKARGGWRNPHVLGSDANEALFLDDKIVVVEGQEDVALLPRVFDEVGIAPQGTLFGWGSGGGDGGPRRIVALLAGLGFKRVVALLDADKPAEIAAIRKEFPDYLATTIPADDIRDKPSKNFEGKVGLLDERGKAIKPELKESTHSVLASLVDYFADTSTEAERSAASTERNRG